MTLNSLPVKINAAIITTAVAISVLFISILYPLEIDRRKDQLKRINLLLDTVFKQKLNDLANELFAGQERALKATLRDIQTAEGIIGVSVFEETGRLFVSSDSRLDPMVDLAKLRQLSREPGFQTIRSDDRFLAMYFNRIEVIGKKIGYVVLFYDLAKLERESRKAVSIIFILPIATVLLMAVLLNLFLFRSIIRPMTLLRTAMRRVEEGFLGETVTLPGKDEIGDMGLAFNDMSRKLQKGHEDLILAEEKYRSIFENAIEAIFQYDPVQERFITVNPSMAAILGYDSPGELLSLPREEVTQPLAGERFFRHRSDQDEFYRILEEKGRVIGFEVELTAKDGSSIWGSISARRVTAEDGSTRYYEGAFLDITEHRQRQAAEQEREAAESASRAKSEFLAKMSHEIRTPLNAILGFADILESSLRDDSHQSHARVIKSSGTSLLELINDILDLSKIEAGKMEIRRSAVNLRTLTTEMMDVFSISAMQKGIVLQTHVAPDVPEFLMLDRARLRQVLFNLMGNAVKFTDHGTVDILCKGTASKTGWDLEISVRDTGPGIAGDDADLVFESFHRHTGDHTPAREGTGLGLAISKSLVEMMNGRILLESRPDSGSIFTIRLPGVEATTGPASETAQPPAASGSETDLLSVPARVLVVDDLNINRQLIAAAIKGTQLVMMETDNGEAAVSMAARHRPDLILMDIKMPGISGYEAIRRIREQAGCDMPVIAITAAGMREDIRNIQAAGFDDYLIRPFNRDQLLQKLALFLADTGIREATAEPEIYLEQTEWDCPAEAADLLRTRYLDMWKRICKRQRIPDIISFSHDIRRIGDRYGIDVLVRYGRSLASYADTIDIDNLRAGLDRFPGVLKKMKIR